MLIHFDLFYNGSFFRLRSVTDILISKQSALEELQSERSSLLLQLERATSLRELANGPVSSSYNENSTRVLLNVTDDGTHTPILLISKKLFLLLPLLLLLFKYCVSSTPYNYIII